MPVAKKQMLRIMRLVDLLKADRYPNCASAARMMRQLDLEENLNVSCSAKTIYRDIQTLKDDFNAPIQFDSGRNGYYLTDPDWSLLGDSCEPVWLSAKVPDDVLYKNVVIRCDAVLTQYVKLYPLHNRQYLRNFQNGAAELHIDRIQQKQVLPWLMNFCPHATVLAPDSLRQKLRDISEKLMMQYNPPVAV